MSDVEYKGYVTEPPDGYMAKSKFRIFAQCNRCRQEFSWVTTAPGGKDRPCPKKACKDAAHQEEILEAAQKLAGIIENGPPAVIGRNPYVKAADKTAEMVMRDFGMTDLKDNIREGESMAPKLPAPQQKLADNFFNPGASGASHRTSSRMARLGAQAIAGSFRDSAINPTALVGGSATNPTFRSVGKSN